MDPRVLQLRKAATRNEPVDTAMLGRMLMQVGSGVKRSGRGYLLGKRGVCVYVYIYITDGERHIYIYIHTYSYIYIHIHVYGNEQVSSIYIYNDGTYFTPNYI